MIYFAAANQYTVLQYNRVVSVILPTLFITSFATMLNNIVDNNKECGQLIIVQSCFIIVITSFCCILLCEGGGLFLYTNHFK